MEPIHLGKPRQETPRSSIAERAAIASQNRSDNAGFAGKNDQALWVNRERAIADAQEYGSEYRALCVSKMRQALRLGSPGRGEGRQVQLWRGAEDSGECAGE